MDVLAENEAIESGDLSAVQTSVDDFWTEDQIALKEKRMQEYEIKKSLGLVE